MDKKTALRFNHQVQAGLTATKRFLSAFEDKRQNMGVLQAFDSLTADTGAMNPRVEMPEPLKQLLSSKIFQDNPKGVAAVFDGIEVGVNLYRKNNGGDYPSEAVVMSAIGAALNGFTELSNDDESKRQFDKLSFDHHEALSVVPAAIQVTILNGIANSLPIVAMLPNPTGSNEVPLLYGNTTANIRMGVMNKGDAIDGEYAGMPYAENRHTVIMTKKAAVFEVPAHVGYIPRKDSNGAVVFDIDVKSKPAPILGGRSVILVKGTPVANTQNRNHNTKSGTNAFQALGKINIDGNIYLVKTGVEDLDNHAISVEFDASTGFTVPGEDDVEVQFIFDYERKDANGNLILTPPGLEIDFNPFSVFSSASRMHLSASIDSITQMQNELGLTWNAAVLAYMQRKYQLEQTARLLREARNACLRQKNRTIQIDLNKDGIHFNSVEGKLSAAKGSMSKGKLKLAKQINRAVGAVDYFVGDAGAIYFNSLGAYEYTSTGLSFGENFSIYRIGTLNDGTNVYYVPSALGVFNDTNVAATTAEVLSLPRPTTPETAPFVGTVSVPLTVINANPLMFEDQVGIYVRDCAERNPNPRFANQGILMQISNIPSL